MLYNYNCRMDMFCATEKLLASTVVLMEERLTIIKQFGIYCRSVSQYKLLKIFVLLIHELSIYIFSAIK